MIYAGDYQLGQEVPITCQVTDGVSPVWPDAAPQLVLFNEGTLIRRILMPAASQAQIAGLFRYPLFLDESFPASGPISGFCQWLISGVAYAEPLAFRILPGGNAIGQIVSMAYVKRPSVGHILTQLDSGTITKQTNPRVSR